MKPALVVVSLSVKVVEALAKKYFGVQVIYAAGSAKKMTQKQIARRKNYHCQLILCGSASSYMVGKVIRSKALYGRINIEMNIQQLPPNEARLFFKKDKTALETMKYFLVFGGIPKYLSDIEQNLSFEQNLCNFFFDPHSSYIQEYEKIFYSQFKEHAF